jgi:hypothetical protein
MEVISQVFSWILLNYQTIIVSLVAILSAFIVIFSLVPGEQPDKTLKAIVDFISKFSVKSVSFKSKDESKKE